MEVDRLEQEKEIKKKISIITTTRAEYGILHPLIERCLKEEDFETQVLVTGTHLSQKFGNTIEEIIQDGIPVFERIPILEEGEDAKSISKIMANTLLGFTDYFLREMPDFAVILGDRTELLGICGAAMNTGIPLVHLHGGELTEGAVDDMVRHAVTKMSYLHFPSTEIYRRRIIQLGEEPDRVFNVGALGIENIKRERLWSKEELKASVDFDFTHPYVLVTYHPETLEDQSIEEQLEALLEAMDIRSSYHYLITKANSDQGGEKINRMLESYGADRENVKVVSSLGRKRYLSAVPHSEFVLGNSSSGLIEVPALAVPTVNIGDRQRGRIQPDSVISCGHSREEILKAMDQAQEMREEYRQGIRCADTTFGDGNTSEKIVEILKEQLSRKTDLKKQFYDW